MSWAAKRRFIIVSIIVAIAVAFIAILAISVFYKSPTCSDKTMNQGEQGIDCGGPCAYLCTASERPPTVLYTRAIDNGDGRVDVVASVENENASAAARAVPYTVTLYGTGKIVVQKVSGTLDLLPSATTQVYIPGVSSGKQRVVRAFLDIDPEVPRWFALTHDPRIKPVVSNTVLGGTATTPRIDAVLTNDSVTDLSEVRVVVLVHNTDGEVIAASQTIMPTIPAQGSATATFTWNTPFSALPTNIEVIPVIPLPDTLPGQGLP